MKRIHTISIIGSFRRHYPEVVLAIETFSAAGIKVLSPERSEILDENQEFVRFTSDPPFSTDAEIQDRAFANMLRSDAVFVVAPDGYVGRTTCLELGRLMDRDIPIFYSESPRDLPIRVGRTQVLSPDALVARWATAGSLAGGEAVPPTPAQASTPSRKAMTRA
ncbi:MAG: hypothetical protein QOG34_2083 [Frankiaceae bacterium]|jgi:hypothetical protein|nr:hypothetical protein [Frankiaceae bacterium]